MGTPPQKHFLGATSVALSSFYFQILYFFPLGADIICHPTAFLDRLIYQLCCVRIALFNLSMSKIDFVRPLRTYQNISQTLDFKFQFTKNRLNNKNPNCKDLQFGFYLQYIHNSIFAGFCILPQQLALVLDFHHYTFFNAIWRVVGNFKKLQTILY